jgi:hypothetical protein
MARPVGLDRMGRDAGGGGGGPERMDRMGRGEPMGRGGRGGRDAGPQRGGRAPQMQRRDDRQRVQDNGARSLSSQRRDTMVCTHTHLSKHHFLSFTVKKCMFWCRVFWCRVYLHSTIGSSNIVCCV